MKKYMLILIAFLTGINLLNANPIGKEKAQNIAQKFAQSQFGSEQKADELQLVYTGVASRYTDCFYVYNVGEEGFVIVSADDRFRPIVGYSDEGSFDPANIAPEFAFYMDRIIEARSSRNAVAIDHVAEEWQSVAANGKLLSRNGGRGVDFLCQTRWNQDSPYNLYAPEASGGPGERCYAGCVATAMSQVMKYWNHPLQGTGSHTYNSGGWWGPHYYNLYANFGATTYDWDNMPVKITNSSPEEQIDAIATLMYHCGVSVEMGFASDGSGANSEDVPYAISTYFSYSNQAELLRRDNYQLSQWQNMLKESFDLGWPVYYSGYSDSGGHAFVCDGYDDNDLFHYNWGWGGSNDGWFVIDEIDYAGWAGAIFNFVPDNVYDYMPLQPENLTVEPSGDFDYAATLHWTNPTQNIHFNNLSSLDCIVVTRNGEIIHTENNVALGAEMTFTDYYMPAVVDYAVYAVAHDAKGLEATESNVFLGPSCLWTVEMSSSDAEGWHDGALSFVNTECKELANITLNGTSATQTVRLPYGHVDIHWNKPTEPIEQMSFTISNSVGERIVAFEGSSSDIAQGLFFVANNSCEKDETNLNGPANLTASQSGNNITLSWEAITDRTVLHYQIYRDNILFAITPDTHFAYTENEEVFHNYYVVAFTEDGETHPSNYCNIQPESACLVPTNLRYEIVSPTKVKIMWDVPEDEDITGYYLYRRPKGGEFKRVKALSNNYHTDNLTAQPDNRYEYAVSAYYRNTHCTSGYASSESNPELNFIGVNKSIVPQQLTFTIEGGHVVLHWQQATMAQYYNIYRDGERIAQGVTDNNYADYDSVINQVYHYYVTGNTDFIESSPSNDAFVDWTTGISEPVSHQGINIYPNPSSGIFTIEAEEASSLQQADCRIFNLTGQEVMHLMLNNSSTNVDLSSLPDGTYFVKIVTPSENKTTKIVKIQ